MPTNGSISGPLKNDNSNFKPMPSFLENRNMMKGSMITT